MDYERDLGYDYFGCLAACLFAAGSGEAVEHVVQEHLEEEALLL